MITNKKILIIGGTGALGSNLAKRYYEKNKIMVMSRNEHKQEAMKLEYPNIIYRLGDIKSKQSLSRIICEFKPEIVINTAAVKTVWVCQDNPMESVETNIIGHQNLLDVVDTTPYNIETIIFISTDKACKPVNVYGMSKAIAEQLYVNFAKKQKEIKVVMARYGNVLNSTGSIIPVFKKMINDDKEFLPITDFKMTRFLLTIDQAINMIEWAYCHEDSHGKIAIPKIKSLNILDLAKAIAKKCNKKDIKFKKISIKRGEKLHEDMISEIEFQRVVEYKDYYLIGYENINESYEHRPYNSQYHIAEDVDKFFNDNEIKV